ncbi:MAG: hypothetical protein ACRCTE_02415 [Cellulosilyticaceae bacterium]
MKSKWIRKVIIMMLMVLLIVPTIQATDVSLKKDLDKVISEINNIRKQFMAISESGYINHVEGKSNGENVDLVKVYLDQVPNIRKTLLEYQDKDLDKFEKRKTRTLLATVLYLEDMGQNLIDYLSSNTLKDQYDYFSIHIQLDEFIVGILADVQNTQY